MAASAVCNCLDRAWMATAFQIHLLLLPMQAARSEFIGSVTWQPAGSGEARHLPAGVCALMGAYHQMLNMQLLDPAAANVTQVGAHSCSQQCCMHGPCCWFAAAHRPDHCFNAGAWGPKQPPCRCSAAECLASRLVLRPARKNTSTEHMFTFTSRLHTLCWARRVLWLLLATDVVCQSCNGLQLLLLARPPSRPQTRVTLQTTVT